MNSIFGIGVLEFVFILIFALIFLGPERLPKVTRETLQFIRRLQKLSGDLTRQVNEEIGDLRELDPSYHMKQLMDEEEDETSAKQGANQKSTSSTRQTSAPSQSQTGQTIGAESIPAGEETIAPEPAGSTAQPGLSDLNASASANGRQGSGESADAKPKPSGTSIPSAPRAGSPKVTTRSPAVGAPPGQTGATQKRGVKTLAELRKQKQAKRQAGSGGSNSSYLEERNKRAQRRADDRRQAVAAQKDQEEETAESKNAATDPVDAPVDGAFAARENNDGEAGRSSDGDLHAEERGADPDGSPVVALTEASEEMGGDGSEETPA